MLISNGINEVKAASWQELIDEGNIDIGNHSKTHELKYNEGNPTAEELADDITGGYNELKQWFPNEKILTFAAPWCRKTDASTAEIKKHQYANRGGGNGFLSANPTEAELFDIPAFVVQSDKTAAELNANIDTAIKNKSWYSVLLHGYTDTVPETKNNNILKDVCIEHFNYIGSKSDKVWAGSLNEVVAYIYEKQNCDITVNWIRENGMSITLTDTLDNDRFDFPLTLKVHVPDPWETVTVTQNYKNAEVSANVQDGKNYVYINVVPDKGEIILENK